MRFVCLLVKESIFKRERERIKRVFFLIKFKKIKNIFPDYIK
jgi:hypothetical protein